MVLKRTIPPVIVTHLVQLTQCTGEFVANLEQNEEQIAIQDGAQAGGLGVTNVSCSHSCTFKQQKTLHSSEKVQSACMEVH